MKKYDTEMENELTKEYLACTTVEERSEVVDFFVAKWGKSRASLISKLSKMGIYVPNRRVSKITGEKPETKEQLVGRLEDKTGFMHGKFAGLEKAPKIVILRLLGEKL
jgi:hypothetical protein